MPVKYRSDLSFKQSLRIPFSYVSKDASPSIVTLLLTITFSFDNAGQRMGYRTMSIGEKPYLDPAVSIH